jgi:cytochrome c-type biogenesis protein CcmE
MKTFLNVCRWMLVVLTVIALSCALVFTAVSASIRLAFTPENIYRTMSELNYAEIRLPDGYGGFPTIRESVNDQLGYYGMELNENDFNDTLKNYIKQAGR